MDSTRSSWITTILVLTLLYVGGRWWSGAGEGEPPARGADRPAGAQHRQQPATSTDATRTSAEPAARGPGPEIAEVEPPEAAVEVPDVERSRPGVDRPPAAPSREARDDRTVALPVAPATNPTPAVQADPPDEPGPAGLGGLVVDERRGRPVPQASLVLTRLVASDDEAPSFRGATLTDSEGRFHFEQLPAGRYRLSARSDALGAAVLAPLELPPDTTRDDLILTLGSGASLDLRLRAPDDAPLPAPLRVRLTSVGDRPRTTSLQAMSTEGRYRRGDLEPGTYTLRVHHVETRPGSLPTSRILAEQTIVLAPGVDRELELILRP